MRSVISPDERLGWWGLGSRRSSGTILPTGVTGPEVRWSTKWKSWRMRRCDGRPRCLDTSDDLFRELVILERAAGMRRKAKDRFLVCRALFQTNAARNDSPEDLGSE